MTDLKDYKPSVVEALSLVMDDVQAVRKLDRNQSQNFNFRGIDAVINAVGPSLRKRGVVAVPVSVNPTFESYQSKQGATMRNCTMAVTWRFYGPAGDHIEAMTLGEAADAGDKSVAKAHSVAYRILLLQALCIPTDEPDPDASAHERAKPEPPDPRVALQVQIRKAGEAKGLSTAEIRDDFTAWAQGELITEADAAMLEKYLAHQRGAKA